MFEKTDNHDRWSIDDAPLNGRWNYKNTYEAVADTAKKLPNKPAISFQLRSGPGEPAKTLSWEDYRAKVAQCANGLRKLGIGQDDVVAYVLPNCLEAAIVNQAGMAVGIVNPVNPLLSPEHIGGILHESGAKAVVTLAPFPKAEIAQTLIEALQHAPNVKTILTVDLLHYLKPPLKWLIPLMRPKVEWPSGVTVKDFDEFCDQESKDIEFELSSEDRICALFHTGGTTGRPKLAQHRVEGVLYNGWLGRELIYKPDDVVMCPLPLFHVFAAYPILECCIFTGCQMVMVTPAGYRGEGVFENFWKLVERWKVSMMIMVPTAAGRLMSEPVNADVSTLRLAVSGSAPLPQGIFKRFEEATGVRILEGYGMTEATCLVAVNPLEGDRKIGSVGYPLPYTDVKIFDCDKDGNVIAEKARDEIGEICVSNPGVFVGSTYREAPANVGLYASTNYLRTGDLGYIDGDGVVWITGRAKDLIIRGGHNIDPAIIEEALAAHPAVGFVGAIGQPDSYAGEVPCAYVELVAGQSVEVADLIEYCEKEIAESAAIPKYIEIMDELPKTAVGKTFKPDLRKMAIARVFAGEFAGSGLPVEVAEVIEDKHRGLVARLQPSGDVDEAKIADLLSNYSVKWEIISESE